MVHVITAISYDCTLLPHFVHHYQSLGVNSFFISINKLVDGIWDQTAKVAKELSAEIKLVEASERQRMTGIEGNNKEELRQSHATSEDWLIPADLDEFVQFPAPIADLISEMNEAGSTFMMGNFVDRIALDGALTPAARSPSIWTQYPLECHISERLVKCWCHKVALCRGDCELTSGHHNVIRPARPHVPRTAVIHHFKWRAGLLEALRRRIAIYRAQGQSNFTESERILEYYERQKRFRPADFAARPGWNPIVNESPSELTVYTAVTNGYDKLKEPPPHVREGTRFVAFTDAPMQSGTWDIRPCHDGFDDPCRNAKIHKILPHRFFPNSEYSLWIDASVVIKLQFPLQRLIELYLSEHDLAVFRHPSRRCIFHEAGICIAGHRDDPQTIRKQMVRYRYEQFPTNAGLAECTVLLRRHTASMRQFDEVWWDEISNHSRRDQLSFNYVAWKLKFKYKHLPGSVHDGGIFQRLPHEAQTRA